MSTPVWSPERPDRELVEDATALFRSAYGRAPDAVFSAPGRVNLLGEHVDYSGGTVMPLALPQRTFVAVGARGDDVFRAVSAQAADTPRAALAEVGPGTAGTGWFPYVVGVPWAMLRDTLVAADAAPRLGLDLAVDSTVPLGAGLSSSAALECAVALAVDHAASAMDPQRPHLTDASDGRRRLAAACVRAENEIAGASTGGMDQSIALRAEAGSVLSIDCRDFSVAPVDIDLAAAGLALLVIDTNAPHRLVDGQYAARRAGCEEARVILGVPTLRDAFEGEPSAEALAELLAGWDRRTRGNTSEISPARTEELTPLLRHAWSEMVRVRECQELFADPASRVPSDAVWERLGGLLDASHASLRDDYRVSCPELDTAVLAAQRAGALGARMTGGGFGGSAIALVRHGDVDRVAEAVAAAFDAAGYAPPVFLTATPSGPARREA
ncbi:galactokinase [Kocuria varians]|uniref:galactokinase n=1 Tax=Kocuria varians TaxID=1272 RepID=UPI0009EF3866|nr:galactokinase [Kocuria varians]